MRTGSKNSEIFTHLACLGPTMALMLLISILFGSGAELRAFFALHRQEHPDLTLFMVCVTDYALYIPYAVFLFIFIKGLLRKNYTLLALVLAFIFAKILVSVVLVNLLKIGIGRPRPLVGGEFQPFSTSDSHHSMPSGHAASAGASTGALSLVFPQKILMLFFGVFTAFVAFSRIYLSKHELSDVVAGALVGYFGARMLFKLALGKIIKTPGRNNVR